jgi:hypothetical protein
MMSWRRNETVSRIEAKPMPIAGAVDELIDRAAVETGGGRPRNLDMLVVDQAPRETSRRHARVGLALPHRQGRAAGVGNRIEEGADKALLGQLPDVVVAEQPRYSRR